MADVNQQVTKLRLELEELYAMVRGPPVLLLQPPPPCRCCCCCWGCCLCEAWRAVWCRAVLGLAAPGATWAALECGQWRLGPGR